MRLGVHDDAVLLEKPRELVRVGERRISVTKWTGPSTCPGSGRAPEIALDRGVHGGDRDDVVAANLPEEERAVGDADPRLLDDPVRTPVVQAEQNDQQHDVAAIRLGRLGHHGNRSSRAHNATRSGGGRRSSSIALRTPIPRQE